MTRVLILSSDRRLGGQAAAYLKSKGYEARAHTEPQQAISAANTQPPDIAVIDLLLAGRSGVEFLYELRSYPEWQNIPVILSGNQQPADISPFRDAFDLLGVSAYLPAPLTSLAILEQHIRSFLRPATA